MLERLVLASDNPGKLRELESLLSGGIGEILPQSEFDISSAPEPHTTFVENALAKARATAAAAGLPALADDSGLCVEALGGAPGVRSARFAGVEGEGADEANNDRLLAELDGAIDRRAHYHCSLVLCRSADDPSPLIAEGRWHGTIGTERIGSGGFGYDPLFRLADGRSAAELAPAEKNGLSHRGIAARRLAELLAEGAGRRYPAAPTRRGASRTAGYSGSAPAPGRSRRR